MVDNLQQSMVVWENSGLRKFWNSGLWTNSHQSLRISEKLDAQRYNHGCHNFSWDHSTRNCGEKIKRKMCRECFQSDSISHPILPNKLMDWLSEQGDMTGISCFFLETMNQWVSQSPWSLLEMTVHLSSRKLGRIITVWKNIISKNTFSKNTLSKIHF